jgi:hypothetical protein
MSLAQIEQNKLADECDRAGRLMTDILRELIRVHLLSSSNSSVDGLSNN